MAEDGWKVRAFNDEDFQQVSRLRELFTDDSSGRRSSEPSYYRWKILTNPVQRGLLYVAEDQQQIIGMLSITPKRVYLNGNFRMGAELGDGFVNPSYHRRGIFSSLLNVTRKTALEQGIDFIYGTPNEMALPAEKRAGYAVIPTAYVYNLVRPLNIGAILEAKFGSPILAKTLGPLADSIFRGFYEAGSSKLEIQGMNFELASTFPDDIYTLWERASLNYDLILERSKQYLEWRYIRNPDSYSIWLAQTGQKSSGYLITKLGTWRHLKIGFLADFLIEEHQPEIFTQLILRALSSFSEEKVDMVAAWAVRGSSYYKILKRFGFKHYKAVPIICYKNDLGNKIINSRWKWHFTMADSDNI